ncbi:MAG: hypothetical protein FWF33_07625, partial [Clostridiales bacterium]|nr:hypothetical protein [Clostridiales bacterium]
AAEDFRGVSVSAVGSVEEEVGARGAHIVSAIIHPDVCIVLDVTLAGGVPDAEAHELPVRIGGGPAVTMFHWGDDAPYGTIVPEDLLDRIEEVAARENIPVQPDNLMGTWTDGFAIERSGTGVKTCGLSIPSRYVHTAVGIVDLEDMQKTADLAVALVKSFYTEVWND